MSRGFVAILVALAFIAGALWLYPWQPRTYWHIPDGYPEPPVPPGNPLNDAKIELGRLLFYDSRLSINGSTSCGTCHQQQLAFTDGRARSVGATGELHPRGSMSLVNVAYASRLTWANQMLDSLEVQALTPMFGENPVEMGLAGRELEMVRMLSAEANYRSLFASAFPGVDDPISVISVVRAIAAFVRTIVSFESPYDEYVGGNTDAMSASQIRGLELFNSEQLECFHCHGGFNFTDSSTHANAVVASVGFHNTGLYNIDLEGAYPPENTGLYDLTAEVADMGRFRAPSLRNISLTAPYMHDGSIASLEDVIDHYARGGRLLVDGPYEGDGSRNPFKSEFVRGFEISAQERQDLLAFLQALTDNHVVNHPQLADPYLGQ